MDRVLVAGGNDDELRSIEAHLLDRDLRLVLRRSHHEALAEVAGGGLDLAVVVLPIAELDAAEVLHSIHRIEPRLPVVLVTAGGSTDEAIEAIKAGAFDYLLEPLGGDELTAAIDQGIEAGRMMRSVVTLDQTVAGAGEALVGRSRPMQEIYKAIGRVAPTDSTVLIRGESGTGKELVARAIYQHSRRANRPFVVVNCVAIPETLLESELFGYERGAFTGAIARRIGKVEQAGGGTLFLDEIGDMPAAIQAKILRLLEDRRIERLGGRDQIPVDVRILAATNRDLEAAIGDGRFRKDLYYRLNVVPITLLPLRERLDDLPLLCDYFLGRLTTELGIHNPGIGHDALELLASHDWPGNVRELANAMEQCLVFCRGRRIGAEEVSALVLGAAGGTPGAVLASGDEALGRWIRHAAAFGRDRLLATLLDHVTRRAIVEVLELTGGNRSRAARLLGVSRPTLLAKMRAFGLDRSPRPLD